MCVWIEDADQLTMEDSQLDIVYKNTRIKSFLNSKNILGLAGIKGQGKTFLLKVKRKAAERNPSITCFPYSRMVDTIDSSATLEINDSLHHFLSDYNVWVNLWKLSICGAIIVSQKFHERFSNRIKELILLPD